MSRTDRDLENPPRRRLRVGILRTFILVLAVALLLAPVGVQSGSQVHPSPLFESMAQLARGQMGIGILSALVAGSEVAWEAAYRLGLSALAWIALALTGFIRSPSGPRPVLRRRRCPECGSWVSADMWDCPACGHPVGPA